MKTLVFDPSGNYEEGKGTTGWAIFESHRKLGIFPVTVDSMELVCIGEVSAVKYDSKEEYWQEIADLILANTPELVVCESFRLFHHKAKEQSGSRLETPQLIGYLRMVCYLNGIKFVEQAPSDKTPVNDERLTRQGIFTKSGNRLYCGSKLTNLHMRDAIRHGVYYFRFGEGRKRD